MKEKEIQQKRAKLQENMSKLLKGVNLESDLLPYLSPSQKILLKEFFLNQNKSTNSVWYSLGMSASELLKDAEKLVEFCNKLIIKKQEIDYLLKHYGGLNSIKEMANAMPENYKKVLLQFILSPNPSTDNIKEEYGVPASKIDVLEMNVIDLLDEMHPRKLQVDNLVESAGGRDFVFNVFAKTLTENQNEVLTKYTLSYLPLTTNKLSANLQISVNDVLTENNFLLEKLNKIIAINEKLSKALCDPNISGYRLKLTNSKIRKVLSSMPTVHQKFAEEYFGNETSLNQMARNLDMSVSSISSRKKHFFEIFYKFSQKDEDELVVNTTAKSLKTTQRQSRTSGMLIPYIEKLASFEPDINVQNLDDQKKLFEKYLYPYICDDQNQSDELDPNEKQKLSETRIKIFERYMLTNNGVSAEELAESLGLKGSAYIYATENSIYSKLDYIIDKKIKIDEFYKTYGGVSAVEDFKTFLTKPQKIVLDNYFLSLSPCSNQKTLKLLDRAETGKNGFGSIRESVITKLDEVLKRKNECKDFISQNGGIEFLLKFAETLSEEHKYIFNTTMIDYHYTTLRDVSLKLEKFDHYAQKAQGFILKKLDDTMQKEAWVENVYDKLGDKGIERFIKTLNEREQKILTGFTLNSLALSITDYIEVTNENYSYVSKTNAKLKNKLDELVKAKIALYGSY